MALSAFELTYIRRNTGNFTSSDSAFYTSDVWINWLYTNKADADLDKTIVFVLRELVTIANDRVDTTTPEIGKSLSSSQQYDHLLKLLERAEKRAGMGGKAATGFAISLGIDTEEDA